MHLLYKKQGETCGECLKRLQQRLKNDRQGEDKPIPASMTYAGRLDPLAGGLLIVLEGKEIEEKDKYLGLPKTYEFEVVLGIATDSFDQLGVIMPSQEFLSWPTLSFDKDFNFNAENFNKEDFRAGLRATDFAVLQENFKKLIGPVTGTYPFYSSKPIDGVPLFQYVKNHGIAETIPKLPTAKVEIYDIEVLGQMVPGQTSDQDSISFENLRTETLDFANKIKGDFRQEEIIKSWMEWGGGGVAGEVAQEIGGDKENLKIMKFRMTVSSGFYIRSFACWLGQIYGTGAIARNIMRTKVGEFRVEDVEVEDVESDINPLD